jgi:hypothetical protein
MLAAETSSTATTMMLHSNVIVKFLNEAEPRNKSTNYSYPNQMREQMLQNKNKTSPYCDSKRRQEKNKEQE